VADLVGAWAEALGDGAADIETASFRVAIAQVLRKLRPGGRKR
jgi:hypothetical protein